MDFFDHGCTINRSNYVDPLVKLREVLLEKCLENVTHVFLQDNAPAHKNPVTMNKVVSCRFELLPHPLTYPNLAPSDLYLYMKHPRVISFTDDKDTKKAWRFCRDSTHHSSVTEIRS